MDELRYPLRRRPRHGHAERPQQRERVEHRRLPRLRSTGVGTATVDGAGSVWSSTSGLYVGGSGTAAGGTGQLTVQNYGLVSAGGILKVWDKGTVNVVTGGQLVAGGPAPGWDGSLTIGSDAAASLSIVGGGHRVEHFRLPRFWATPAARRPWTGPGRDGRIPATCTWAGRHGHAQRAEQRQRDQLR